MNPNVTILVSVLAGAASAVGVTLALRPVETAAPTANFADLQSQLGALREANVALKRQLDSIVQAPAPASAATLGERIALPAVSTEQVAAAVEAYLQQRGGGPAALGGSDGKLSFDMAKDFDGLKGNSYWTDPGAWKKAFAAGRMDEVIEQFEALAKQNPNDVETQMNLANAYMAYLQMDQSKWQYSMKADGVFDTVLELDEKHWEARFTKAMSYTFWPDFLGKKKDAIKQFETLVAQQEELPVEEHHAQTYLFLGNLLETRDPAKAKEIWAKGRRRHPQNQELAKKGGN